MAECCGFSITWKVGGTGAESRVGDAQNAADTDLTYLMNTSFESKTWPFCMSCSWGGQMQESRLICLPFLTVPVPMSPTQTVPGSVPYTRRLPLAPDPGLALGLLMCSAPSPVCQVIRAPSHHSSLLPAWIFILRNQESSPVTVASWEKHPGERIDSNSVTETEKNSRSWIRWNYYKTLLIYYIRFL